MFGLAAFSINAASLYTAAEWMGVLSGLRWTLPVFFGLTLLVFAGFLLVSRARGERTWRPWTVLSVTTFLNIVVNSSLVLGYSQDAVWQTYIAVLIAAVAPIAVLMAIMSLSNLLFIDRRSSRSAISLAQ